MQTSDFDFSLPTELIAQQPLEPRDQSRLLVVSRETGRFEHRVFAELPELLKAGDILVRNNTQVVPARLVGRRELTSGRWEGLFLGEMTVGGSIFWEILATTRGKPGVGEQVVIGEREELRLTLMAKREAGRWMVRAESNEPALSLLERFGSVPLPPYIRKGAEGPGDRTRYQTVYAQVAGAVAAPTAGLHFTEDLFARLNERGIGLADLTLHVGIGTFRPIEAERIDEHVLHAEWAELSPKTAEAINTARSCGGRVVAVGTTSARVLETAAKDVQGQEIRPFEGETAMYLRPGHAFRGLDALVTNFHLPRSSLLVLVSAFAGVELIREAYAEAVRERYRFYSYGDAMLIL